MLFNSSGECFTTFAPLNSFHLSHSSFLLMFFFFVFSTKGAAAILLEQSVPPEDIKTTIIQSATTSVPIKNLPANSHNRILYIDSKET